MPVQQQYSAMEPSLYTAPPEVRGLTCLDKEAFAQTVVVPALQRPGMLKRVWRSKAAIMTGSCCWTLPVSPHPTHSATPRCCGHLEYLKSYSCNKLRLTYDNLKSEEVLCTLQVVHIAHMNLREHQLPYRNIIGQVIMDKNPWVTCVVNKTNTIDSTYRSFKMVMVGEENMVAKVRENGVTYEFDFSCVYWNWVIRPLPPYIYRVLDYRLTIYIYIYIHYKGLILFHQCTCDVKLPQVHCYVFSKEYDPQRNMVERASASLGFSLEGRCSVHLVRNVAPNKEMSVTFTIPKEVLFKTIEEPAPKRSGETKD
uniref:tRNA methyltransferase 5 n=1 Tax=Oncorhynchus tshawytscha TaxID=74940 RepID=A0A8C8CXJ8_ONCTS